MVLVSTYVWLFGASGKSRIEESQKDNQQNPASVDAIVWIWILTKSYRAVHKNCLLKTRWGVAMNTTLGCFISLHHHIIALLLLQSAQVSL